MVNSKYIIESEVNGFVIIEYLPQINYAFYANNCDTVLKCIIGNSDTMAWHDVKVGIDGPLVLPKSTYVNEIGPETQIDITDEIQIMPDPTELIKLSDGIDTTFTLSVSVGDNKVFEQTFTISFMAFEQWIGIKVRPELLAAFITPNHPMLSSIKMEASKFLEKWTGSSALDEYQSQNPNRVRAQVAAIYEAIRSIGLVYASPPPNFEQAGQRVRTIDKIINEKFATCLDLALLTAACLESLRINPIIILTKGHCFVGAWLVQDSYIQPVGDDPNFLLKCSADGINEIVMFETTFVTDSQPHTFEEAVEQAIEHLGSTDFELFIDIYRARVAGIKPIPMRVYDNGQYTIINDGIKHENVTEQVRQLDRYDLTKYDVDNTNITKYTLWERKLLDFSLRNNLLNTRIGKKAIPLLTLTIEDIADCISNYDKIDVLPFPLEERPKRTAKGLYESTPYRKTLSDFISAQQFRLRLHSFLNETELNSAMTQLYRASRTAMEENGTNNLYLALGMLKWYETEKSQAPNYAPLLLFPMEMVRRVGNPKYAFRLREEPIMINITLIELLKQQHDVDLSNILDLPKNDKGVDVKVTMSIIRDKIRHKKGWNVLDEALISLFSFNKFVMWNDIHTNAPLLHQNPIISSMVEGKLNIDDPEACIDLKEADKTNFPSDFIVPIDVDSSQLEAVIAAGQGKSFILHGPPGTGKSQTITNIIANALYHGKRVLFVAEKMAALSVVQSRLEKIGLAPFCLELHSNKVTKRHFLQQMDDVLNIVRQTPPKQFETQSLKLFNLRQELISYIEALHRPTQYGLSIYECITAYLAIDQDKLEVDLSSLPNLTEQSLKDICEEISRIDTILQISGNPKDNPLRGLELIVGSAQAEDLLKHELPLAIKMTQRWEKLYFDFSQTWNFNLPDNDQAIQWLQQLGQLLSTLPYCSPHLLKYALMPIDANIIREAIKSGAIAASARQRLTQNFSSEVFNLDFDGLKSEWQKIKGEGLLTRLFSRRSFLRRYSAALGCKLKDEGIENIIHDLNIVYREESKYKNSQTAIIEIFDSLAYPGHEHWDILQSAFERLNDILSLAQKFEALTGIPKLQTIDKMSNAIAGNWQDFARTQSANITAMIDTYQSLAISLQKMGTVAKLSEAEEHGFTGMLATLQRWESGLTQFRQWYQWCRASESFQNRNLGYVTKSITEQDKSGTQTAKSFAKGVYWSIIQESINADDRLRHFNGLLFDDIIRSYRQISNTFQELSKQELYCKLASRVPSSSLESISSSELSILKRSIKNGARGTSIRHLIDKIPILLSRLTPCMLMSPLSVAQYIDLNNDKFDLVIFDEASQMPTSEAIGAIARGKSLIVVGDPKQMPPTNFFSSNVVNEDEVTIDDMDSILDDCISLSMPSKHLSWHYRSKHESLIAFSNANYYDGNLTTFPSIDDLKSKVSLRRIDGRYDKGHSRSNVDEAKAVVGEVIRRLSDNDLKKQSIGIVSFSQAQQDKIEDLLSEELAKHPALEAIAYDGTEPIFIKNLENVQGDERDVILFSIGYGPDAKGNLSMNFGPLNNDGGERRLNVAVSRARNEMIVFTSIRPEQIDLRRTNALGVQGLKKFLEYAESGKTIIPAANVSNANATTDNVSIMIADELAKLGYKTKLNVGRSQFKIDIAVINPCNHNEFMLGILRDGSSYYSTKTVRDREIVQPSVLGMLKWNILRVWTIDWLERKDEVMKSIVKCLQQIKKGKTNIGQDKKKATRQAKEAAPEHDSIKSAASLEDIRLPYPDTTIPKMPKSNSQNLESTKPGIKRVLARIIATEYPVTTNLLYRRIFEEFKIYGHNKDSVKQYVDELMPSIKAYTTPNGNNGLAYWPTIKSSKLYSNYREHSGRDISEIPLIEIENVMKFILSHQIGIDITQFKKYVSQTFGYPRFTQAIDTALSEIMDALVASGQIQISNDKISQTI